ncbi:hypothetical protein HPP92_027236 [Vanilla planifolia]|uniref:Calcium uniporter protein C-terminal domain-containing protein n=1 Tax=Vanilla planifolia TaxID=51239 RepID=A0A835P9N3_VANPL|nr:hypothetical protein HPP92_027236 [Vanilla planifolia]KAG0449601.1 hypothetical protein HPP92_027302 [Vanilla planifolia]
MALRRALARRFLEHQKADSSPFQTRSSAAEMSRVLSPRRPILQRQLIVLPAGQTEHLSLPRCGSLLKMIRRINPDSIRVGAVPLPAQSEADTGRMTVADVKKVLRASQMEAVRSRLRMISRTYISYSEFLQICREGSSSEESAASIARLLDESNAVITLGNLVFLRPGELLRAIGNAIPLPLPKQTDQGLKEMREMELKKADIDKKAAAGVQRELWCGLGFMVAQTMGFMRLTFWELSWDVMEPICFFATSVYFMAGYAFFLRTLKEPSFEGFFESRFASKQRRIMRSCNFDLKRYSELKELSAVDGWNDKRV